MIRDIDCCVANFSNYLLILLTSCGSVSVSSLNWPSAVCLPELSLFTYKQSYHKMPYQDDKWSLGSLAFWLRDRSRESPCQLLETLGTRGHHWRGKHQAVGWDCFSVLPAVSCRPPSSLCTAPEGGHIETHAGFWLAQLRLSICPLAPSSGVK